MHVRTKISVFLIVTALFLCGCTEHAYLNQYLYPTKDKLASGDHISGRILWHGSWELPEIALTFDDGPSSKYTPKILDILKSNDVKATFFVLGKYAERNKALLKREAGEGHLIGNHTYTHAKGTITDIGKIKRELQRTDKVIEGVTGQKAKFFRPPFGFENWRFLKEAEKLDYNIILWSVDVGDWNKDRTDGDIVGRINRNASNGTIILLHDGGPSREAVIDSLPIIIKGLKNKGYKFVTIDEMMSHL